MPPTATDGNAGRPTTLARQLKQSEDLEAISRDELAWKETDEWHSMMQSHRRACGLMRQKEEVKKRKEEEDSVLALKTMVRRQQVLSSQEQKKRLVLMEGEQLELEGLLRNLERDVRRGVYEVVADVAIRVKYFNKTMDVIVRNEQAERREMDSSERYERLVLKSRMDNIATEMLVKERLTRLRQATESKYRERRDSMIRTKSGKQLKPSSASSSTGAQDTKDQSGGSEEPSRSENSPRKSIYDGRNLSGTSRPSKEIGPRIVRQHPPEFYEKELQRREEKETKKREKIVVDEENALDQIISFLDFVQQREIIEQEIMSEMILNSTGSYFTRQRLALLKHESNERDSLLREEIASWKGILRREFRFKAENHRQDLADAHQQHVHERKITERKRRIVVQQYRVETITRKEENEDDVETVSEGLFPAIQAMTPVPLYVMQAQQAELHQDNGSGSKERGFLTLEEKRALQVYRTVSGSEVSSRTKIEKLERMERHTLSRQFEEPLSYEEKEAHARRRRKQMADDMEKRTVNRLQYEEERNTAARQLRQVKSIEVKLSEAQRQENAERVSVTADYNAFLKSAEFHHREIQRLHSIVIHLLKTEASCRKDISDGESRMRESLEEVFTTSKPAAPRKPVPPLPVPSPSFQYTLPKKVRKPDAKHPEYDMSQYQRKNYGLYTLMTKRAVTDKSATARPASDLNGSAKAASVYDGSRNGSGTERKVVTVKPPSESSPKKQPRRKYSQQQPASSGGGSSGNPSTTSQRQSNAESETSEKPGTHEGSRRGEVTTAASSGGRSSRSTSRKELRRQEEAKRIQDEEEARLSESESPSHSSARSSSMRSSRSSSSVRSPRNGSTVVVASDAEYQDSRASSQPGTPRRHDSERRRESFDSQVLSPIAESPAAAGPSNQAAEAKPAEVERADAAPAAESNSSPERSQSEVAPQSSTVYTDDFDA